MSLASRDSAAPTPPMLKHWRELKAQHRDTILFYRVGDFYEMFNEDAVIGARELEVCVPRWTRGDDEAIASDTDAAAGEAARLT